MSQRSGRSVPLVSGECGFFGKRVAHVIHSLALVFALLKEKGHSLFQYDKPVFYRVGLHATVLALLCIHATPAAAKVAGNVVLTTSAPLADKDGDGKVTISKAIGPFKKGATLALCGDKPAYTYAVDCPAFTSAGAVDTWALAAPLRTYDAGTKYVWQNSYPADPINGKLIERIKAMCKETCIWIGRASTGTIIRDVELTRIAPAKPGEIDAGIKVGGSKGGVATAGVLIERVWSHGWQQNAKPGAYANGDGIVVNRGVIDVTVRNARLDDNADSGIDSKADLTTLDSVSASSNGHYGFRFWGAAKATTLTCNDNKWGCIEAEAGARVTIDRLVMIGGEELVTTKAGAEVTIAACDLSRWTGTLPTKGPGKVTLGPSCKR